MNIGLVVIQMLGAAMVLSQTHSELPFSGGLYEGVIIHSLNYVTCFIVVLFFNWQMKATEDFMKQTMQVLGWENQFKNIFDNLEEPVLIFSEDQAVYTNDEFLNRFQSEIMNATVSRERETFKRVSCGKRMVMKIKNCLPCLKPT